MPPGVQNDGRRAAAVVAGARIQRRPVHESVGVSTAVASRAGRARRAFAVGAAVALAAKVSVPVGQGRTGSTKDTAVAISEAVAPGRVRLAPPRDLPLLRKHAGRYGAHRPAHRLRARGVPQMGGKERQRHEVSDALPRAGPKRDTRARLPVHVQALLHEGIDRGRLRGVQRRAAVPLEVHQVVGEDCGAVGRVGGRSLPHRGRDEISIRVGRAAIGIPPL